MLLTSDTESITKNALPSSCLNQHMEGVDENKKNIASRGFIIHG